MRMAANTHSTGLNHLLVGTLPFRLGSVQEEYPGAVTQS
jgi:hypothetical protein